MADLNILIVGKLDETKSIAEINKQLKTIQAKLDALKLDLKIDQKTVQQMQSVAKNAQSTTQTIHEQVSALEKQGAVIQTISKHTKVAKDGSEELLQSQIRMIDVQGKSIKLTERQSGLVKTTTQNYAEQLLMAQKLVGTFDQLKKDVISSGDMKEVISQINPGWAIEGLRPLDDWGRKWEATLSNGANASQKFKYQINSLTGELYAFDKGMKAATNRNLGFAEQLRVAIERIPVWMIGMQLFYSTLRFFTKGIAWVNDFNKALTEISIVTNKNQREVEALGRSYAQLASQMGVTTREIANASVEFYRQGLSQAEVMERVKVATQYAKVANMDFAQSSEILTAAVNSMGLSIDRVADVYNLIGDLTSTGPDELGIAFQKVGGTVKAANIEFEKMASWIAIISARTRESPSSIGDSMKSMLARFMNITQSGFDEEDGWNVNDVSAALKTVGIDLINEVSGNFRDFGTILDELGEKWQTLDSRTKAYLGTALAGTRQQSRFYSLMEGYSDSIDLYNKALNAAGTTTQKYNRYLDSTEASLNRLTTAGTGVWQKVFDSATVRSGINSLTALVNGFSNLVDIVGFVGPAVFIATSALVMFNENARKMLTVPFSSTFAMLTGGFTAVGAVASKATVAVGAFMKTLWPMLIISTIAVGIEKFVSAIVKANQKRAEFNRQQEETINNFSKQEYKIEKLIGKYKDLSSATSLTDEQHQELTSISNELAKLIPSLVSEIDEQGNAHLRTAQDIEVEIQRLRELKKAQDDLFLTRDYPKQLAKYTAEVEKYNQKIATLEYQKEMGSPRTEWFNNGDVSEMRTVYDAWSPSDIARFNNDILIAKQQRDEAQRLLDEVKQRYNQIVNGEVPSTTTITPPNTEPTIRGSGSGSKDQFSERLELWQHKLDALNNSVENAQRLFDKALTDEQKQTAYDNLIKAFQEKQEFLRQLNKFANDEEWLIAQQLQSRMSAPDFARLQNGDASALTIYDEETAKLAKAWQDARSRRQDTANQIVGIDNDITSAAKSLEDFRKEAYDKWLKDTEKLADDVVDAFKDMYKQELELEEHRHKEVMDDLDDELDKYEELVNEKLKLLDRTADEQDYNKELTKAQAESQKIRDKISVLSLDNSMESVAKRRELEEELADIEEKIAEMKQKRNRELQRQGLQDNLDAYRKDIEGKKKQENKKYEAEKNRLNALLNDEKWFAAMRQAIISGDTEKIKSIYGQMDSAIVKFMNNIHNTTNRVVQNDLDNLITKIQQVYSALENRPTIIPPTPVQSLRSYVGNRDIVHYDEATDTVRVGNKVYTSQMLRNAGLYMQNDTWYGTIDKLKNLLGFDTGGYTGDKEGLAYLHKKELVLKDTDTFNLLNAVRMVRNLVPQINMNKMQPAMAGVTVDLDVNIANMSSDEKGVKRFFKVIGSELEKSGVILKR